MSPPAGYRLVTPEDREAHPLVPPAAKWMDSYGRWWPTKLDGDSWDAAHRDYAIPLGLWPEGDPAPEPATVQVPAELATEISEYLRDLMTEWAWRRGERGGNAKIFADLERTHARLRACPGYGSDGARTVRKEATP